MFGHDATTTMSMSTELTTQRVFEAGANHVRYASSKSIYIDTTCNSVVEPTTLIHGHIVAITTYNVKFSAVDADVSFGLACLDGEVKCVRLRSLSNVWQV